jgi:hypothetical protein
VTQIYNGPGGKIRRGVCMERAQKQKQKQNAMKRKEKKSQKREN